MTGYITAGLAVAIFAAYPVATRADVVASFQPDGLVLLRFGVASLLFLPYVFFRLRGMPASVWRTGATLSIYQGAGMAALVICGLQFAPASHAAALGPGVAPAWAVLFGYLLFSRRQPAARLTGAALIVAGAVALVCAGNGLSSPEVLLGDALFLGASALGALYFLRLRDSGIGVLAGAAVVSLYSAAAVIAWVLVTHSSPFAGVRLSAFLWQVLWQGVLIGFVALIALNHAISKLGGERASALMALVPVSGMALGGVFLAEVPSSAEWVAGAAISLGVVLASLQAGNPAASSALAKIPACGLSRPG
jgi:drug/metabolite transporter (DMT)-like permease